MLFVICSLKPEDCKTIHMCWYHPHALVLNFGFSYWEGREREGTLGEENCTRNIYCAFICIQLVKAQNLEPSIHSMDSSGISAQ